MVLTNLDKNYRQCSISVLDNIADPNISFDENGRSNYYHEFKKKYNELVLTGHQGQEKIEQTIAKIKLEGMGKPYDCIAGLSGGVDSSYVVYIAKKYGLRPLVVHFDNGWNSELAVKNIESIVNKLNLDLYTLVVDWNEFKDIQLSYLKASVIDIEVVTDHAVSGTIAKLCKQHKIKYSLTGSNVVGECIMPSAWIYHKSDHVNLKAIHKTYGTVPIKTYPLYNTFIKKYTTEILKTESIDFLNWMPYNKEDIKKIIASELGWRDYGGKHYESRFTKFYQAYILPTKFNVDKRKPHLSNLIFAGQITKEEALQELQKPLYTDADFREDYDFVLKKFGLSDTQFKQIMNQPPIKHTDFPSETSLYYRYPLLKPLMPIINILKRK